MVVVVAAAAAVVEVEVGIVIVVFVVVIIIVGVAVAVNDGHLETNHPGTTWSISRQFFRDTSHVKANNN